MYRIFGCLGLAVIAAVWSWEKLEHTPSPPPPVVYREAPTFWDTQFADRANIEQAILRARASIKAKVIKASLRRQRRNATEAPSEDRMAAAMQSELKRLGCYTGKVDNVWGRGSQKAVGKFNKAAALNLNERVPGVAALARLEATYTPVCAAPTIAQNAAPKTAVVTNHQTLSANLVKTSVAGPEKSPSGSENSAATSYLPPWTKKSANGDFGTAKAAPRAKAKSIRRRSKSAVKARVTKNARARRSAFGKNSFSFAWPGQ